MLEGYLTYLFAVAVVAVGPDVVSIFVDAAVAVFQRDGRRSLTAPLNARSHLWVHSTTRLAITLG